ncbi:hypothetical protein B296_00038482 [Ensete ventricosum]|uniref:Uncharacterized protein n=1 Tax=Ensete ventricosum TaxID=4639 RepID=A0A426ZW94_ENSVE|nr:hypothetical protein B296_00038482 [Ensete ventricosum]
MEARTVPTRRTLKICINTLALEGEPMLQEHPPSNGNAEHLRESNSFPRTKELIASAPTPNRYWRMLTDLGFSPPVVNLGPPIVTTKAFLDLTQQVQALAGMVQTIVSYLPQLIQSITSQHPTSQLAPLRVESPVAPIREDQPNMEGP